MYVRYSSEVNTTLPLGLNMFQVNADLTPVKSYHARCCCRCSIAYSVCTCHCACQMPGVSCCCHKSLRGDAVGVSLTHSPLCVNCYAGAMRYSHTCAAADHFHVCSLQVHTTGELERVLRLNSNGCMLSITACSACVRHGACQVLGCCHKSSRSDHVWVTV